MLDTDHDDIVADVQAVVDEAIDEMELELGRELEDDEREHLVDDILSSLDDDEEEGELFRYAKPFDKVKHPRGDKPKNKGQFSKKWNHASKQKAAAQAKELEDKAYPDMSSDELLMSAWMVPEERKEKISFLIKKSKNKAEIELLEHRKAVDKAVPKVNLVSLESQSIEYYQGDGFYKINDFNRTGKERDKQKESAYHTQKIDEAIDKSITKEPLKLYRGVAVDTDDLDLFKSLFKKGGKFTDKSFVSSTPSKSVACGFATDNSTPAWSRKNYTVPTIIEFTVPAGSRALAVQTSAGIAFDKEVEILLPRNSAFKVKDIWQRSDGMVVVEAEYLSPQAKTTKKKHQMCDEVLRYERDDEPTTNRFMWNLEDIEFEEDDELEAVQPKRYAANFNEQEHPRGQPENKGEFAEKPGSGEVKSEAELDQEEENQFLRGERAAKEKHEEGHAKEQKKSKYKIKYARVDDGAVRVMRDKLGIQGVETPEDFAEFFGMQPEQVMTAINVWTQGEAQQTVSFKAEGEWGTASRIIKKAADGDGLMIRNYNLDLKERGAGMGPRMLASEVKNAIAAGVKRITCTAGGEARYEKQHPDEMIGYRVWPKLGFDGPIPRAEVGHFLPEQYRSAKTVLDLFAMPGGREWWTDNGVEFEATFDLAPGSRSRAILTAYIASHMKMR